MKRESMIPKLCCGIEPFLIKYLFVRRGIGNGIPDQIGITGHYECLKCGKYYDFESLKEIPYPAKFGGMRNEKPIEDAEA